MANKEPSSNRKAVRIQDAFTIDYNIITQEEYDKKVPLYIGRRTINRTAIKQKTSTLPFDWSHIEDEVDFDPVLVKIMFYLDQKIDIILSNQEKILKKLETDNDVPDAYASGKCIDISATGINMFVTNKLNEDTLLELTLAPPNNPAIHIIALCKLKRISPSTDKETNGFEISLTFTAINEDDREELIKYIFQRQREMIYTSKRSGDISSNLDK
ncbi:MAG: PilZ domain-containing protein [Candidatus Brocadiaceae bacterium]|nr:PilZ domain-containing protein [Candidatus Brocadiaceae bacterium]